ncbi:hypothetical protein P879_04369 [Paragonimus westermani]|uniref:Uncharacterized protein n=1 Tax=Paragonimus westermani TaxID=34504 RepID=A0A8T0DE07_9TREM|nr:hypothetical protein P879_04369 [Paragonimus westermani]
MMTRTACSLFVGSNDQLLRVYRYSESVVTGPVQTLDGPGGSITSLSVEGRYVAAGYAEGVVKVWRNNVANTLDLVTVLDLVADCRSNGVLDTDGTRVISVNLSIDSLYYTRASRIKSLIDLNSTDQVSAGDTITETFPAVDVETSDVQNEEAFAEDLVESIQPSSPSLFCTDNSDYEHSETELSVSDTEAYWHFMSKPDRPQSVQKSCLLQSGLGHDQARLQAQDSAQVRLTVSQQLPAGFRFRTFAPLLPDCRAVLTGHSGLVACGLAGDNMDDSTVISGAGQSASDGGNKLGACDVRFWNLPADDTVLCFPSSHHEGSITCLSCIHSPTTGDWCLSGGMDSKLFFWRPCTRTSAFPVHHPLAMLNSLERDGWIPTFQVLFARDQQPIFPITAVLTSSSSDLHRVFVSTGREVWSIEIPDKALTLLTQQGSLSVEKLAEWSHCHTNSDPLKVESTFLDQAVIDLCPSILADNVQIDLFASLSDSQFPLVPLSSQSGRFERVSSDETIEFHLADPVPDTKGALSLCWHRSGETLVGLNRNVPIIVSQSVGKFLMRKLFGNSTEPVQFIEPVDIPSADGSRGGYFIISVASGVSRGKIVGANDGRVIAESEPFSAPISIDAACSLQAPGGPNSWASDSLLLLIATSDGLLHLLEFNPCGEEREASGSNLRKAS